MLLEEPREHSVRTFQGRVPLLVAEAQPVGRGAEADGRAKELGVPGGSGRLGPAKLDSAQTEVGPAPRAETADQRGEDIVHVYRRYRATAPHGQAEVVLPAALFDVQGDGVGDQTEEARETTDTLADGHGSQDEIVDDPIRAEGEARGCNELQGRVAGPFAQRVPERQDRRRRDARVRVLQRLTGQARLFQHVRRLGPARGGRANHRQRARRGDGRLELRHGRQGSRSRRA